MADPDQPEVHREVERVAVSHAGEPAERALGLAEALIAVALDRRRVQDGHEVIGLDNLSPYYDVSLKEARLARLTGRKGFRFIKADLADRAAIEATFAEERLELQREKARIRARLRRRRESARRFVRAAQGADRRRHGLRDRPPPRTATDGALRRPCLPAK